MTRRGHGKVMGWQVSAAPSPYIKTLFRGDVRGKGQGEKGEGDDTQERKVRKIETRMKVVNRMESRNFVGEIRKNVKSVNIQVHEGDVMNI